MATKKPRAVTRSYSLTEEEVVAAVSQYLGLAEDAKVSVSLKPKEGSLLAKAKVTQVPWVSVALEVTSVSGE